MPPKYLPFDETHPLAPQNVYALSKVANEKYADFVARQYGLSVAVFRLPWTPPWRYEDAHLEHIENSRGKIDGFGAYVSAADAARAYALALEQPRPGCEIYHLSAPEIISGEPLATRLAHRPDYPALPADWPAFKSPVITAKAENHFGWKAQDNVLDDFRRKFGRNPGENRA